MNIDNLNDREKSVLLARFKGWSTWEERGCWVIGYDNPEGYRETTIDLYAGPMEAVWLLLNWWTSLSEHNLWEMDSWLSNKYFYRMNPEAAKRTLLDKILRLAVTEGNHATN